jgi:hypothetical protein
MLSNLTSRGSMWDNISGDKAGSICPFRFYLLRVPHLVFVAVRLMTITRIENRYNRSELALGPTGVRPITAATWRTGDT